VYQLHELDLSTTEFAVAIAASAGSRGADAIFVSLASHLGVPLLTWDRQQRERGAQFCRTMTPVEAMELAE
jgi:predicted nucleic acid-binding protein